MPGAISLAAFAAQTEDPMRAGLIQKITNESLFLKILRFVQVDGFFYEYAEQTTLGGIAFRGLNQDYTPDVGVINPKQEDLAIFGGEVRTDRQLAIIRGGVTRANAIMAKVKAGALFYDKMVIDGDPATTPKSFYGLNARLTGNQVLYPATDVGNGAEFVLGDVDALIDRVAGTNDGKVLVMNKAHRRRMKQLAVLSAGGAVVMDVGKSLDVYDHVPIQVIDEDGDQAPILGFDETRGNSNITSSMYCIRPGQDPEGEYVQGLVSTKVLEHVPQGVIGTSMIDLVEMLGGLGVFHGRAAARLAGLLA